MALSTASRPVATVDTVLQVQPDLPTHSSRDRAWPRVTVDLHAPIRNIEVDAPPLDHHVVIVVRTPWGRTLQKRGGRTHEVKSVPINSVMILAAGHESFWGGDCGASVRVRLPTELLADASTQMRIRGGHDLPNVFGEFDPTIENLVSVLSTELERPDHPAQGLIVGATTCALAAHLLRRREGRGEIRGPAKLSPATLSRIVSHIEDHVASPIHLHDLAMIANVSPFHFARLFRSTTGMSPMAYVERSRIRRAELLMRRGELSLSQIATLTGFADQSYFTRRFQRHRGCTPAVFARALGISRMPRRDP